MGGSFFVKKEEKHILVFWNEASQSQKVEFFKTIIEKDSLLWEKPCKTKPFLSKNGLGETP